MTKRMMSKFARPLVAAWGLAGAPGLTSAPIATPFDKPEARVLVGGWTASQAVAGDVDAVQRELPASARGEWAEAAYYGGGCVASLTAWGAAARGFKALNGLRRGLGFSKQGLVRSVGVVALGSCLVAVVQTGDAIRETFE